MLMRIFPLVLAAAASVAACSNSVYFASHTVVGLNAAINTQQTAGHLTVGYDRWFATNPPISVTSPAKDGKPATRDAMAVLSCSELEVTGIFLTGFTEHLATGEAAKDFAEEIKKDPNKVDDFFKCSSSTPSK